MPRRMSALDRAIDTVSRLKSPALMRVGLNHMRTAQALHDTGNAFIRDVLAAQKTGGPDEARRVHAEYEPRLAALEQETARLSAIEDRLFNARARAFATVREWARARYDGETVRDRRDPDPEAPGGPWYAGPDRDNVDCLGRY